MRIRSLALIALFASAPLAAQVVHTKPSGGSAGVPAAVAPLPPVIVLPGNPSYQPGFQQPYQPGAVFYGNLPVVVLPDGRVYANFGRGYEQIVRTCSIPVNYGMTMTPSGGQPTVTQPTVVQPGVVVSQPLPYTPPVPNQQTASQQMLDQQTQQTLAARSTIVNSQSCWARNGHGRVYVGHP